MNSILFIGALMVGLAAGWVGTTFVIRGLDYWSRRVSVGTLYLQWMQDK